MVGSSPRVFSESIFHDSIFYCSAPLCLGFRLTFKRYIYLSTIQVIPTASQVKCFPIYLSFPGTLKELENTFAFLAKKLHPPLPTSRSSLCQGSTRHKVLWLIPSLSYQPRSGEQEREKETTRGCKENPCKLGSHKRH